MKVVTKLIYVVPGMFLKKKMTDCCFHSFKKYIYIDVKITSIDVSGLLLDLKVV